MKMARASENGLESAVPWFLRLIRLVVLKIICEAHVKLSWCILGWYIYQDVIFGVALSDFLNYPLGVLSTPPWDPAGQAAYRLRPTDQRKSRLNLKAPVTKAVLEDLSQISHMTVY